jgi:hypothetical protein
MFFQAPALNQLITGTIDGMEMTEPLLLGFAAVMELGMVMILGAATKPPHDQAY